ncbi:unnamed protein product [Sphagnum troendelagicum]
MGAEKLSEKFPALVLAVRNTTHIVTSFSDPMHGSTIKAASEAADSPLLTVRPEKRMLLSSLPRSELFAAACDDSISLVSTLRPENKSGVELALAATRDLG